MIIRHQHYPRLLLDRPVPHTREDVQLTSARRILAPGGIRKEEDEQNTTIPVSRGNSMERTTPQAPTVQREQRARIATEHVLPDLRSYSFSRPTGLSFALSSRPK